MKTNIVHQLISMSDKITDIKGEFYRAAEDYLRSVIKKQKDEKIDLRSANIVLIEKYRNPFRDESKIEDLEYLYFDGDVSLAAGGYDYLLTSITEESVIRLVKWVKDNA